MSFEETQRATSARYEEHRKRREPQRRDRAARYRAKQELAERYPVEYVELYEQHFYAWVDDQSETS